MIENLIELSGFGSGLKIAAGKQKRPKPFAIQGFWTLVPVTGLDCRFRFVET